MLLTGVPDALKRACAEYALRALTASLAPDTPAGGPVSSEQLIAGPFQDQTTFAAPGSPPKFPAADRWLAPLLYSMQAVRA